MASVPPLPRLDNWNKGDKLIASHLNQPLDALRAISHYGATVQPPAPPPFREMFIGFVTDKGPHGETYTQVGAAQEQYWVQKQFIRGGKPWDQVTFGIDDTATKNPNNPSDDGTITVLATNLPEWTNHTHSLPKGTPVVVFAWWDGGLTPNGPDDSGPGSNQKHYFMWQTSAGDVVIKLTGNGTGTGRYAGTIYAGANTDAGTGALTMPDGLTAGQTCTAVNLDEDSGNGMTASTHRLATPQYVEGIFVGMDTEGTPKPLVMFHGGFGRSSPLSLPGGGYGAADSTTYSLTANDGGCTETFVSAFGFDSGSGKFWWHTRTRTTDARGMLRSVSAETEHTQATGPC